MPKKRNKTPRRNATRKLALVSETIGSPADLQPTSGTLSGLQFSFAELDSAELAELAELARMVEPIGRQTVELIRAARTALDAEMCGSTMLGMFDRASAEASPRERLDGRESLLGGLIGWAEVEAAAGTLALLRVLEVIGSDLSREAAAQAAQRLSAAGVADRPWARVIGRPRALRAFRYGDIFGSQESATVLFDYNSREHSISVLIDHELGGGVKDCWIAEGKQARGIRNHTAIAMAAEPMAQFEDIAVDDALELLADALEQPPCPVEEDQIEDVAVHLPLIRARVRWLESQVDRRPQPLPAALDGAILRLKVTLRETKPPIWRRLEVPTDVTLDRLHHILQTAFGWTDSHLHAFEQRPAGAGRSRPELRIEPQRERRTKLGEVAGEVGASLLYEYDFGDGWEHLITVEKVEPTDATAAYPRCTDGRRCGPPEDCGGAWGYSHLLEVLADPNHEEHDELLEWVGGRFDPEAFDRHAVTTWLTGSP